MNKYFFTILFSYVAITSNAQQSAKSFDINSSNTKVQWVGKKVGGKHEGYVSVLEGKLEVESKGILVGGNVTIDMNSITCTDISDAEKNAGLVGHLKNADFFDVEKFPTSNLVIKKVSTTKKKGLLVTADLTIKGITKTVTFPAAVKIINGKVSGKAVLTFDRTKYDVKYGSTLFGAAADKAIDNNVVLNISIN